MSTLANISSSQLKRAAKIKDKIESLNKKLSAILGDSAEGASSGQKPVAKKRRKMSAAVRAKMAASAKARWAKAKSAGKSKL